jgi:HPt (histidine-containing phosphotransfer) domain-containing protein
MESISRTANPDLSAALDRLWARFLPEIRERVAVLDSATQSLSAHSLTVEQQQAAHAAAHKLAGTLGTFNLHRGTELARELENHFAGASDPQPGSAPRLVALTAELRSVIESRQ